MTIFIINNKVSKIGFFIFLVANNASNMASVFDSVGRRIETFVLFSGDLNL